MSITAVIHFLIKKIKRFVFFLFIDNDNTHTNLSVPYFQEGYVHYVVDAVFTLVIAVKNLVDEKCLNSSKQQIICQEFYPLDGLRLLTILRNVSFRNGKLLECFC